MRDKLPIVTRKINWVSSLMKTNQKVIRSLEERLDHFYSGSMEYYSDIDYTATIWNDKNALEQQDLIQLLKGKKVLEVGCGKANILMSLNADVCDYSGVDFSSELMAQNRMKYPRATFAALENSVHLPFENEVFDVVFSNFVIEHTTTPHIFLDENLRVLKKGGYLIVICPDFLGRNRMTSQRTGFSLGTGRQKLQQNKYFDALVTGFDNKIRIPSYCMYYKLKACIRPGFYINLSPTCFVDQFQPDLDAVYLTYEHEIKKHLKNRVSFIQPSDELKKFTKKNKHIYIKGTKKFTP